MADQKCWTCKKYSGGCPWTVEDPEKQRTAFKPVPGWIAVKTVKHDGSEGGMESYQIIDCPMHESDGSEARMEFDNSGPELKYDLDQFRTLFYAGMTDKEIGSRMGMPSSTVQNYKERIRREQKWRTVWKENRKGQNREEYT